VTTVTTLEMLAVRFYAVRLARAHGLPRRDPRAQELVREASIYVEGGTPPADAVDFAAVHVLKQQGLPPPARLRVPRPLRD
jgi:hypothetical protein